jgi:hypothetical protein
MNKILTLLMLTGFLSNPHLNAQGDFKTNSILVSGSIHRISVSKSGVYKLDYNFIKDKIKIDPGSISPDRIIIAGNGAGRIPQWSGAPRVDDLDQIASLGVGLDDGHFDNGDYLLWYAEGPEGWKFDSVSQVYTMDKNIYDNLNHYYVIINGPARNKMPTSANGSSADYTSDASLFYQRMEDEKVNLLGRYRPPGSGQEWYGDELAVLDQLDYTNRFDFTDFIPEDTLQFLARFAVRNRSASRFYVNFNANEFSKTIGGVTIESFEASYANDGVLAGAFVPGAAITKILMRYPSANGADSKAWIDFLQINGWKRNIYHNGTQLLITDPTSRYKGIPDYTLEGFDGNGMIWDITDPFHPELQNFNCTDKCHFIADNVVSNIPSSFIAFHPSSDALVPGYEIAIENQDLHELQHADMVILYHPDFKDAALLLAEHRENHDHMVVETISTTALYNEFGGGSQDPSAIRDFARMLHERDPQFKYLLLIGDATYDFLNHSPDVPYENFIPAFETEESLDPIVHFL